MVKNNNTNAGLTFSTDWNVCVGKNLSGVDLSVRVLTTGFWPGQNAPPPINVARIPAQVQFPLTENILREINISKHIAAHRTNRFLPYIQYKKTTPNDFYTIFW